MTHRPSQAQPDKPTTYGAGAPSHHHGRTIARLALAGFLGTAGIGHFTFARKDFQAQVPDWVPLSKDATVLASGVVELAMAAAIASGVKRKQVGRLAAAFFVGVFPGNLHQYARHVDGLHLNTDARRLVRLFFQPVLVGWALEATRKD